MQSHCYCHHRSLAKKFSKRRRYAKLLPPRRDPPQKSRTEQEWNGTRPHSHRRPLHRVDTGSSRTRLYPYPLHMYLTTKTKDVVAAPCCQPIARTQVPMNRHSALVRASKSHAHRTVISQENSKTTRSCPKTWITTAGNKVVSVESTRYVVL